MSKTNTFENETLLLVFNNTTVTGIGSDGLRGSTTAGTLSVALFTADPTESGGVGAEATYTSYDRVDVARSGAGWTVTGNVVSNTAAVSFPAATGGSNNVTYFGICKSGVPSTDDLLYSAALDNPRTVSSGITPSFAIGDLTVTED